MKRILAIVLVLALLPLTTLSPAVIAQAEGEEIAETAETAEAEENTETAAIADGTALKYGDQGDAVAEIQQLLKDLGYYSGKVSGNFLDGTRNAVKKFQKEYELEVTGEVDSTMEALLRGAEYRVLSNGSDGADVKRLQQALYEMNYLSRKATGKFRSATESAVKAFQRNNGLEVTGIADIDTQKLLFSGNALAKGVSATPTPNPDEDLGDINDVVLAGDGETVTEAYESKLKRGAKGENVKKVQNRLTELGYFDGPISGNYMNQTVAAVKAFQTNNALKADGITDENTWNAMFNDSQVVDAASTPRPTPEPTPVPYAITVDVKNQVTTVYGRDDNGEYTKVVKRFLCSTGMKSTPSDVGDWVLNGRRARWCYFSKWGSYAQYWTRINSSIAFHSLIYNSVNLNALSVKSYNLLGSRASHGCVRLLVNDAKWIYDNIGEGTVVTITETLPADEELRKSLKKPPLNSSKTGPVSTPQPTAEPVYVSGVMPPEGFAKMKTGDEGENVYWLQMRLKELGYYNGAVTGGFYSGTKKAVKAYQKDHKIYATGIADEKTLKSIYDNVVEEEAVIVSTPIPADQTPVPTLTPAPN